MAESEYLSKGLDMLEGLADEGDNCAKAVLDELQGTRELAGQLRDHAVEQSKAIEWRDQTIADQERHIERLKAQLNRWELMVGSQCTGMVAVCEKLIDMDDEVRR